MKVCNLDYDDLVDAYNRLKVDYMELEEKLKNYDPERPTLRDRFAMSALTGYIQNECTSPETDCRHSYYYADLMLEARDK